MKNKLPDLNNHLFEMLELLGDDELKGDALQEAIGRSKAINGVADRIIENARLCLDAHKAINNGHANTAPEMIGIKTDG